MRSVAEDEPGRKCRALCYCLGSLVLGSSSPASYAQGTIHVDLSSLKPGEVLSEQFSSDGIHFVKGRLELQPPITVTAPSPLNARASTVGSAVAFGIWFERPISRFSANIAQTDGRPFYLFVPFNDYASKQVVGTPEGGLYPANEWHHVTYTADKSVKYLELQGWTSLSENFPANFYFDQLEVTYVPEPSAWLLVSLGICGFLVGTRKQRRSAATR
jgi:hypothetical protein